MKFRIIGQRALSRVFSTVRLIPEYLLVSAQNHFKKLPRSNRRIVFSLEDDMLFRLDDGCGRHAYNILRVFSDLGFEVYLYKHITARSFKHLRVFGRFMYSIKNLKIVNQIPENVGDMIYAFDTANPALLKKTWKKLIYVNVLRPTSFRYGNIITVPFDFWPWMYKLKQNERIPELRNLPKTLRIFFGGNTAEGYYDNIRLRRYNQITRREGLFAILGKLDKVEEVRDVDQFIKDVEGEEKLKRCFLLRTEKVPRIGRNKWLEIVARSEFFLCLSGTDYPMCHNTVEALALGVIPILAYPDWFFPPLEHMRNAIIYSGQDDLAQKVKEVLALPENKIQKMRLNVLEYYDKHMTPQMVNKDLENDRGDICTLMLYPKLLLTPEEERKSDNIRAGLEGALGPFTGNGQRK